MPGSTTLMNRYYIVYVLESLKDHKTYVGYTHNIEERLQRHNSGQVTATKYRRPLKLMFSEEFPTKKEAKKRELYWKGGGGRGRLKRLFLTK